MRPEDLLFLLRPKDFRVVIIAPDGSTTHEACFGTQAEAKRFAAQHRTDRDVVMVHRRHAGRN